MNSKKIQVPLSTGKYAEGEEVQFKEVEERWNEYELSDGTKLRIKLVLIKAIRTSEYNTQNEPIYSVATNTILNVTVPENLKKKVS